MVIQVVGPWVWPEIWARSPKVLNKLDMIRTSLFSGHVEIGRVGSCSYNLSWIPLPEGELAIQLNKILNLKRHVKVNTCSQHVLSSILTSFLMFPIILDTSYTVWVMWTSLLLKKKRTKLKNVSTSESKLCIWVLYFLLNQIFSFIKYTYFRHFSSQGTVQLRKGWPSIMLAEFCLIINTANKSVFSSWHAMS